MSQDRTNMAINTRLRDRLKKKVAAYNKYRKPGQVKHTLQSYTDAVIIAGLSKGIDTI